MISVTPNKSLINNLLVEEVILVPSKLNVLITGLPDATIKIPSTVVKFILISSDVPIVVFKRRF